MKTAAPKDRSYLEQLNFKQLQKGKKPDGENLKVFYQKLQDEAKSGPVFDTKVLETVSDLPELPKPVTKWIGNLAVKDKLDDIQPQELGLIIDWVRQSDNGGTEISSMSWDEAVKAQKSWHDSKFQAKETGEYKTNDVVMDVGGGYKIVQIKDCDDLATEGELMGHCVGGEDYCDSVTRGSSKIYSLRDSGNKPHVTMEVSKRDEMLQCFGKQNETPVAKYHPYLDAFFRKNLYVSGYELIDMDIPDDVVEDIIRSGGPENVTDLAKATKSEDVMLRLATERSPDAKTLKALSSNYKCTPKVYEQIFDTAKGFSKTEASDVFLTLVDENRCPASVLTAIANMTTNKHVLSGVLRNRNTPSDILDKYADRDEILVARNPNVSAKTLERIMDQEYEDKFYKGDVLDAIAGNPGASGEILARLAREDEETIREVVAANKNTPLKVLEMLAKDQAKSVRWCVKKNPSTPFDLKNSIRLN